MFVIEKQQTPPKSMKIDLTATFCLVDDFCKDLKYQASKPQLTDGTKTRNRSKKLSQSEMITIVIAYHQIRFRDFKTFYLTCHQQLKEFFPNLISYSRFIQLMPTITIPLLSFAMNLRGQCTGVSFIDSTPINVCHTKRINRHKVFEGMATRGRSTKGWFFGFKLHLAINEYGELLSFVLSPGNTDDRAPVIGMCQELWGKLFADKGYISQKLFHELMGNGLQLVTSLRKNMKNKLMTLGDKVLLRKRSVIETVNDQLKNISEIEHSRHRSPANFLVNLISGLIAYMLKPTKPSLFKYEDSTSLQLA